jgi:hypothetical protein
MINGEMKEKNKKGEIEMTVEANTISTAKQLFRATAFLSKSSA